MYSIILRKLSTLLLAYTKSVLVFWLSEDAFANMRVVEILSDYDQDTRNMK